MGLGFTVDTPIKVARFGISSVISIIDDHLLEKMRAYHAGLTGKSYEAIPLSHPDHRALRTTAYLDLVNQIIYKQIETMKERGFEPGSDLVSYFELLPENTPSKIRFLEMLAMENGPAKLQAQNHLRTLVVPGSIDVNIMAKVDRQRIDQDADSPLPKNSDAVAALRGFARSGLSSSVIFSAGLNPKLYSYCESFTDFFPDTIGFLKKKIILKVSDYRSALTQGKLLAKKGLWISEVRVESGLNCGGHAFATEGMLMGPILEEFRQKRIELENQLFDMCQESLQKKNLPSFRERLRMRVTVQGGIGTAKEDSFLLENFGLDGTGWGSPFLLVPEATNVEPETLRQLATAKKEDYYLSHSSPLGIPYNNFRKAGSESLRLERIQRGKPGAPCYKKFLAFDTEFKPEGICLASREYQHLKLKQIQESNLSPEKKLENREKVMEKECLCEGLSASALLNNHITPDHPLKAVSICPGPNLAYFSEVFTLKDMVHHIYGRINLLNSLERPNIFVNELTLYVDYWKKEIQNAVQDLSNKKVLYLETFKANLLGGVAYYKALLPKIKIETTDYLNRMKANLQELENAIHHAVLPKLLQV